MEENNIRTNEIEVGEPQGEPTPEPGEKMFTQEQVNEIIKKRLKKQKEAESSIQELDSRAAELTARESRLNCREYILERGYPVELLDILDTSDVETFKSKADKANGVFESRQRSQFVSPLASVEHNPVSNMDSAFRNTKHKPKKFPPLD